MIAQIYKHGEMNNCRRHDVTRTAESNDDLNNTDANMNLEWRENIQTLNIVIFKGAEQSMRYI